jgi:hypothetical protein
VNLFESCLGRAPICDLHRTSEHAEAQALAPLWQGFYSSARALGEV